MILRYHTCTMYIRQLTTTTSGCSHQNSIEAQQHKQTGFASYRDLKKSLHKYWILHILTNFVVKVIRNLNKKQVDLLSICTFQGTKWVKLAMEYKIKGCQPPVDHTLALPLEGIRQWDVGLAPLQRVVWQRSRSPLAMSGATNTIIDEISADNFATKL